MPELPEVEITRQKLLPLVKGRKILDFWTDWPRGLKSADSGKRPASPAKRGEIADSMRGRKILDVTRRGKVLFFELSGKPERQFAIHLRMSGRLKVHHEKSNSPGNVSSSGYTNDRQNNRSMVFPTVKQEVRWTHFVWKLSGHCELRFIDPRKFGVVWYGSAADFAKDPYLGRLGHDARNISPEMFREIIRAGRGMVKPFLLRQDRLAGIGNIIADESLWKAKIHPQANINNLSEKHRDQLLSAIRYTLSAMFIAGGTTLRDWGHPDGGRGAFQEQRRAYGKAGLACPRCKTKFTRIVVGGRGTTLCRACQKIP